MPDMDGRDTYERIKAISNLHAALIAFFTSLSDPKEKIRAQQMGAVDYIQKPANQSELPEKEKKFIK